MHFQELGSGRKRGPLRRRVRLVAQANHTCLVTEVN